MLQTFYGFVRTNERESLSAGTDMTQRLIFTGKDGLQHKCLMPLHICKLYFVQVIIHNLWIIFNSFHYWGSVPNEVTFKGFCYVNLRSIKHTRKTEEEGLWSSVTFPAGGQLVHFHVNVCVTLPLQPHTCTPARRSVRINNPRKDKTPLL